MLPALIEAKQSATADQEEEDLRQYSALAVTVITFLVLDLIVIAVVGNLACCGDGLQQD
jgi:hypothetical protein